MRPLDWLTAGLAVLAIGGLMAEQFAAAWHDRRNVASGPIAASGRQPASTEPVAPPGPLSWSRRPAIGRRIAAGGQQLNSPRFSCSPAGGTSRTDLKRTIDHPAASPQPGESWPQPSLN
jgi:hypothetical protein